jgi:hypothetical protein
MCDEFRFAIDLMQMICLDTAGGEKAVDVSIQETSLIYRIFGGCLQSQVCTRTALAACTVFLLCVCVCIGAVVDDGGLSCCSLVKGVCYMSV